MKSKVKATRCRHRQPHNGYMHQFASYVGKPRAIISQPTGDSRAAAELHKVPILVTLLQRGSSLRPATSRLNAAESEIAIPERIAKGRAQTLRRLGPVNSNCGVQFF
ncbi:hypothetical protein [Bradyrhizobium sp. USDA 4454]